MEISEVLETARSLTDYLLISYD